MSEDKIGDVRVSVSPNFTYAFILTVAVGICTGVWFFASQAQANAALESRYDKFEVAVLARLEKMDQRDQSRSNSVSALDTRLARIEAQLAFLISNMSKVK